MPSKFVYLCLLTAYCALIYWLSDQSSLPIPQLFRHQDKIFHATAYSIMGLLAWKYFSCSVHESRLLLITSLFFSSLFGATDEWHQAFVPGRSADILDWVADTLGAGLAIMTLIIRKKKGRYNSDKDTASTVAKSRLMRLMPRRRPAKDNDYF